MIKKQNCEDELYNGRPRSVISGMGIVCPIGSNIREFSASLKEGRCGISLKNPEAGLPESLGIMARINNFSFDAKLNEMEENYPQIVSRAKTCARRATKSLQCSVLSTMEAWTQAGLEDYPVSPEKIGIVVSGSNISEYFKYTTYRKFIEAPEYISPSYALQFMDTDQVGTLSEIFGVRGESFTAGGASASGNVGIIKAMQMIELGILDVCLVVGPLTELSDAERMGFYNLGALGGKSFREHPEKSCRPFDTKHEGFICGEGSACLVVESLKSARLRDRKIFAELVSGAVLLDGNRLSNPNEDGEVRTMLLALERAGIKTHEIDYINAHATSTPLGDVTEARAIKRVVGSAASRVWVNSTKSMVGHCLFAAGVVEAVATVLQIDEGFVHPNLNLEEPVEEGLSFCGRKAEKADLNIALSNSFGFGGINTSIILRRGAMT